MNNPETKERVRRVIADLLGSQYFAVLCTKGETHPYCSLVGFAATGDLRRIVFATMRDTRKFRNLSADGRVSMMIDSRTNRVEDLSESSALTVEDIEGAMKTIPASATKEMMEKYEKFAQTRFK